jgi:hypothetical protein
MFASGSFVGFFERAVGRRVAGRSLSPDSPIIATNRQLQACVIGGVGICRALECNGEAAKLLLFAASVALKTALKRSVDESSFG